MKSAVAVVIFAAYITNIASPVAGIVTKPKYNTMCPIRHPFGIGNCSAFGHVIPAGTGMALGVPCVLVECSSSGHTLVIKGCPVGKTTCQGTPTAPVPSSGPWPVCCKDCHIYDSSSRRKPKLV
uniref:Putative secreted peptide n=1 Tax=Hyalomma excavatum TaxID=257692 RepID=A0A131XPZ9_9ACAR